MFFLIFINSFLSYCHPPTAQTIQFRHFAKFRYTSEWPEARDWLDLAHWAKFAQALNQKDSVQPKQLEAKEEERRCLFSANRNGVVEGRINKGVGFKRESASLHHRPVIHSTYWFFTLLLYPPKQEMASFCRSALMAGSRSIARSRTLSQSSLNSLNPAAMSSPFASATRTIPCATRYNLLKTLQLSRFWQFQWLRKPIFGLPFSFKKDINTSKITEIVVIAICIGLFRYWEAWSQWCHFTVPLLLLGSNPTLPSIPPAGAAFLKVTHLLSFPLFNYVCLVELFSFSVSLGGCFILLFGPITILVMGSRECFVVLFLFLLVVVWSRFRIYWFLE